MGVDDGGCLTVKTEAWRRKKRWRGKARLPYVLLAILSSASLFVSRSPQQQFSVVARRSLSLLKELDKNVMQEEWASYDRDELDRYLGCEDILEGKLPIPSEADWRLLRQAYHDVVGADKSTIGDPAADFTAFDVKFRVGHSPGKGRGIFAGQFIHEGELIYNSRRAAQFEDASSFRRFLMKIPADLACQVMHKWSYVQDLGDDIGLRILFDIDPGCMCNSGGPKRANMGHNSETADKVENYNNVPPYFALRDIEPYEELLCNYREHAVRGGWRHFDFVRTS